MKSWVVRVPGPAVAKLIIPRVLCSRTGSSGIRASRHTAATCGSPWIPNCAMNPGDHPEYPRAIVIAACDEVVEPVGPEGGPLAVDLDHEGTFARLEAGAERGRSPHGHGGTRGVVERGGAGGRGFPMLPATTGESDEGKDGRRHRSPSAAGP